MRTDGALVLTRRVFVFGVLSCAFLAGIQPLSGAQEEKGNVANLYGGGNGTREVVFSFDDGPHPVNTPKLLDILAKHGVRAIFFMIGENLATPHGKEILKRISAEGHYVGNHSYTHPNLAKLTEAQIRDEISKTAELIGNADRGMKLLRPPYGSHNQIVDHVARELGYRLVLWNVDTQDWNPKYKEGGWVQLGLDQIEARAHSLVLNHDIHPTTVARVDEFITAIKALPNVQFPAYA
jgi:peptidoglycan/xylan/chitin deacetylase (PgdA/CDA1 family)